MSLDPTELSLESALALGTLQGLTEFLPVSSSGHISIGGFLFGLDEVPLSLSVLLHLGTLLATLVMLGRDVARLSYDTLLGLRDPRTFFASDEGRIVAGVVLATIPTAAIGLAIKDRVEAFTTDPIAVGLGLLTSAAILVSTRRAPRAEADETLSLGRAILVGIAQGFAVLPGVSRSGTTIALAMWLGMRPEAAFRFSFLLSIPAVLGASVLTLGEPGAAANLPTVAWLGGALSAVVGVAALVWLRHSVTRCRLWTFALYLVPVGIGTLLWGALR